MIVVAWIAIVLALTSVVLGPFLIGKPREDYSASSYLSSLLGAALFILLAGRVLGWW